MPDPWKKLLKNVKLVSGRYNGYGYNFTSPDSIHAPRSMGITREDLINQFEIQNGLCFWFKIKLDPNDVFKSRYPLAMSVDRLDNTKGYEKDNIVITSRLANLGRGNCDTETFHDIMNKIKYEQEN